MQAFFKRYESKYLIGQEQHRMLFDILRCRMEPDHYDRYIVQNLYYDTDNWDIIRASVEKPLYKEKMRLRCYGIPNEESSFFLELKKKYNGIVYKRRIAVPACSLTSKTIREAIAQDGSQIARELDFYMKANDVVEKVYISYKRMAFSGITDSGLRVTFDTDIRFRLDNFEYNNPDIGYPILSQDKVLMEIKTLGGMPLWLAHALSGNNVLPTAFSKYGTCYSNNMAKEIMPERAVLKSA